MLRGDEEGRTTFAGDAGSGAPGDAPVRRTAARFATWTVRLIVAPFAAVAAAVAGLMFAALLPICGIATICEGIAKASWRFARGAFEHSPQRRARRV